MAIRRLLKCCIWILAIAVVGLNIWKGLDNRLGPDPGKALTDSFGLWALRFLLATLAMRPLFDLTGKPVFLQLRRALGLFSWFFATLHFAAGLFYVIGLTPEAVLNALREKTYVVLGLAAWLLMLPLGLTSNRYAQRRLGLLWTRLHRLIYPMAVLACLHFVWLVRSDYWEPALYSLLLAAMLGCRAPALRAVLRNRLAW